MPDVALIAVNALCLALIAALGFAAQRASLCTVRAVEEVITSRSAYMLASFAKAALWASAIYGAVMLAMLDRGAGFQVHGSLLYPLLGGFVFGVGAAVTGGCAMSVLQRLADGDLTMVLTLLGLGIGMLAWTLLDVAIGPAPLLRAPVAWHGLGTATPAIVALVALLAALEIVRLWRSRPAGTTFWQQVTASQYRFSTAALLIGTLGGVLYALKGAWSYTNYLRSAIEAVPRHSAAPGFFELLLLAALFGGMVVAAVQRGTFRWRSGETRARWRALTGGTLMGIGAAMIPGGNDTLLLTGLPTLSLHALGTYAALLAGVAATLLVQRRAGVPLTCLNCRGDRYREIAPASIGTAPDENHAPTPTRAA